MTNHFVRYRNHLCNIGIHCLDVFVEHNIFRLPSIVDISVAFEIVTLYLCLLNAIRLKKNAV